MKQGPGYRLGTAIAIVIANLGTVPSVEDGKVVHEKK